MTHKQYLTKVLHCFDISKKSKHVSAPLASHMKLSASLSPSLDDERECMSRDPYANVVGNLMYVMVCTRPDISHAIGVGSRYMHDPGKGHWQAMKWIMLYLLKTIDVGLVFERDDPCNQYAAGYVDSGYASDLVK